jgi:callose synthase
MLIAVTEMTFLTGFFFSVYTPYYSEIVMYSMDELRKENEDGISTLFYLQKIFPGI